MKIWNLKEHLMVLIAQYRIIRRNTDCVGFITRPVTFQIHNYSRLQQLPNRDLTIGSFVRFCGILINIKKTNIKKTNIKKNNMSQIDDILIEFEETKTSRMVMVKKWSLFDDAYETDDDILFIKNEINQLVIDKYNTIKFPDIDGMHFTDLSALLRLITCMSHFGSIKNNSLTIDMKCFQMFRSGKSEK